MYLCVCTCIYFYFFNVLIFQVFENGKDTGEISICINQKDLLSNSPNQTGDMMEKVSLLAVYL